MTDSIRPLIRNGLAHVAGTMTSVARVHLDVAPPDIAPARPTQVYDTYWRFAAERQAIFFARLHGQKPWTSDPILQTHKFTNAYRASDRVSQYLIRNVIYRKDLPTEPKELFFRIILFKLFNRIETWEHLETEFGRITFESYNFQRYDHTLTKALEAGRRIYSAAYIMPSARVFGHKRKHSNHLALLERMIKDDLPAKVADTGEMAKSFRLLLSYPSLGDFLAYQYITDLNYSHLTEHTETEFVVAGPGALDGISKCFADTGGLKPAEIIKLMADRQEVEFARLGLRFQSLWGRRLQLIDCQNLFCEVSKYSRKAHPEVKGIADRTQIKQQFAPHPEPIPYWYPPKWGLNDRLSTPASGQRARATHESA